MATCILPELVEKIKSLDLVNMNSEQRIKVLDSVLGAGQGRDVNKLFEKSLLLKNQEKALGKFIDDIDGVSLEKRNKMKERIALDLAERRKKIYNPDGTINENFKSFEYSNAELLSHSQEILNKKYDLDIPDNMVEKLFKIKKEAEELSKAAKGTPDGSVEKLIWGDKLVEYSDTIFDLKNNTGENFLQSIKRNLLESKTRILESKGILGKTGQTLEELMSDIVTIPTKGIKAAWDASFMFRQGLKVLTADPKIWGTRTTGALKPWTAIFNKEAMEEMVKTFKADLVTRDLYQYAIKSKLAIGVIEDFFPTNIAEKIPGVGGIFKASDDSFTMFSQGARMDLFEKYVNAFKASNKGVLPSDDIMKSMASYVNALTGRGNLGKFEPASGWLNQMFFSIRYQVANLKTFSDPLFAKTPEVKAIAAKNLAVHSSVILGAMTTIAMFTDVGFNPKESTFGKARIPGSDKWVDITGGLGSYLALLWKMSTKLDGKLSYGESSALDIFVDFLKGKLAPIPGAARDYLEQRDYGGKKPTLLSTLNSLFTPITVDNVIQNVKEKEEANILGFTALFDIIGAGVSSPKAKTEGTYKSPLDLIK